MPIDNVLDVSPRVQYVAATSQTAFDYPFPIFADGDLVVDVDGVTKTLTTHYTVTGEGEDTGGTVTFLVAPGNGAIVTIYRDIPIERTSDFQTGGPNSSRVMNDELDRITLVLQQLESQIGRSLRLPITGEATSAQAEFSPIANWLSKYVTINASGVPEPAAIVTGTLSQSVIAALLNPQIAAEAGKTIVNSQYPPGYVLRYGTNTAPGTTDMTAAIQTALDVAHAGVGVAVIPEGTYLCGTINWPGNNISLVGAGSGYGYNSAATPKTTLKAKTATTIMLDLVQTGGAEDRTGNYIADIEIDGNAIATIGISCAGANIIERVRVTGCTTAGIQLEDFTNSTRLVRCALSQNTGWGLMVTGASATTFSVTDSVISLNTLGGVNMEAGNRANFTNCVVESNTGPGLRIYRPSANNNAMTGFFFEGCWFEDNANATPFFTIVIDSAQSGDSSKDPERITFRKCRIACSDATEKYLNIAVAKWVTFDDCIFAGSTQTDALTVASRGIHVAFLECASALLSGGLTETQLDNAVASGTRCYHSDRDVKRSVGGASPAVAFQNSWVNFAGGTAPARYWFDREGNVCIEGAIKTGTPPSTAFTLPAGYRPATSQVFSIDANGAHGAITIGTNGTVAVSAGSATLTNLSGIRFPTG